MKPPADKNTFTLVSLGCPKNRVDSERILGLMSTAGFAFADENAAPSVVIINTCAFIRPAVEESIDTILDFRADFPDAFLVVAGCMPIRYGADLKESLPEVDLFICPDEITKLPALIKVSASPKLGLSDETLCDRFMTDQPPERVLTTPGYAYLKIAEGCYRKCRYCTIPSIRGPLRSATKESLIAEAESLAKNGAKELILVAQDLTAYGRDRRDKDALIGLLTALETISGINWIRLMYLHPAGIPEGLPEIIRNSDKILPYLDIPFQHVSEKVLKAMGRPGNSVRIRRLIDRLRKEIPDVVLRTTLMVGYPTEGESEFAELTDFVTQTDLEHVGVFTYSAEEGTKAHALQDRVPQDEKDARANEIRSIHSKFRRGRNKKRMGSIETCLVEGVSDESDLLLQARTWDMAPEIDGALYITAGRASAGGMHKVRITGAHETDLFGEVIDQ